MCAWGYVKLVPGNDKPDKFRKPEKIEKSNPKSIISEADFKKAVIETHDATRGGFGMHQHITSKVEKKVWVKQLEAKAHAQGREIEDVVNEELKNLGHHIDDQESSRHRVGTYERDQTNDRINTLSSALQRARKKLNKDT